MYLQKTTSLKECIVSDILYVGATAEVQHRILQFLKKHTHINDIEMLEQEEDYFMALITTVGNPTIIERINANKCFHLQPVLLLQGREIHVVGTKKKENIQNLLTSLEDLGDVKLLSVVTYSFDREDLTHRQKDSIEHAYSRGYYEWPRKADIEKLAKEKGLSKSTYVEHLRKAEIKVVKQFCESN
jgi:predicted DNA binding protein